MNQNQKKNTKKAHIRDASERKDKVTSVRGSEEQFKKIQNNAKAAGMSFNNYLVTAGVNGNKALTPESMVQLQNLVNYACAAVEMKAPDEVVTMQEGANMFWQKLI